MITVPLLSTFVVLGAYLLLHKRKLGVRSQAAEAQQKEAQHNI
jgi:branched-subunit amino acid ABC-type transport system permease component